MLNLKKLKQVKEEAEDLSTLINALLDIYYTNLLDDTQWYQKYLPLLRKLRDAQQEE